MQPFILASLPDLIFDIVLLMQTHAVCPCQILASAAEKRANLRNSAAFWQASCRVVTFYRIVTLTMTFFSTCAET